MVWSPHTWWPVQPAGQLWWGAWFGEGAHNGRWIAAPPPPTWPPTGAGRLAGQAIMYVGSTPCMWASHHVWVPHHESGIRYPGIQVSRYPDIQVSRYPGTRYQIPDTRYQVSGIRTKMWKSNKLIFPKSQNYPSMRPQTVFCLTFDVPWLRWFRWLQWFRWFRWF